MRLFVFFFASDVILWTRDSFHMCCGFLTDFALYILSWCVSSLTVSIQLCRIGVSFT